MTADHSGPFDYNEAFSRNIGWVTEAEQLVLKSKRVAIAGVGGVGGLHLLTHTRLGIGNFHISDLDIFEQGNFNRQAGAFMHTVGRPKAEVMAEMAKSINPDMDCKVFPDGINSDNVDEFLDGVDLYIDGLDFFVLDIRREVFAKCWERGIPAVTAAPLGMGTALLCFIPGQMSFEDFFCMEGCDADERQLRFLLGLSPAMLQMGYLADESRIDFEAKKGPSTPMACELCAGVAATNSLKILLNRGSVLAAPYGLHFDAYKNKTRVTWRPGGNRNPFQQFILSILRKRLSEGRSKANEKDAAPEGALEKILYNARWAPSGDNHQPCRFDQVNDSELKITSEDTREWCVYDLKGRATQIAIGAMLENLDIAASSESMTVTYDVADEENNPNVEVCAKFLKQDGITQNKWFPYLEARVTQRRPLRRTNIEALKKEQLAQSLGENFDVLWIDGKESRWQMAKLLFRSAKIRLITKEGYDVHSRIIDWNKQFSETKIPDQAVGLDRMMLKMMKWSLASWDRVKFLNKFAAGTIIPRLQLDLLPAYCCGAHFILLAKEKPESVADFLEAGRALQRFWLEATRLGLQFQPEMTPLIFSQYMDEGIDFTENSHALDRAREVRQQLAAMIEERRGIFANAVFMGRLGYGSRPEARSTRLPLSTLLRRSAN